MTKDHVDWIVEEWARELPGVDTTAMAIVGRVLRASRHLQRDIERSLAPFGLNMTEFNILGALRRTGAPYRLAPVALSRSLLLTSGGLTKRLDHLELHGLVERSPDPEDRRSVLVELTPSGYQLVEEAVRAHLSHEARLIAPLSPAEQESLNAILRTFLVSLADGPPQLTRRRARQPQPMPSRS